MTAKNIKELAELAVSQCREKLIDILKDYGMFESPILTYRIVEGANGLVMDDCYVIGIINGEVLYSGGVVEDIAVLSVNELYDIAIKIKSGQCL